MFIEQPEGLHTETVSKTYVLSANSSVTPARKGNEEQCIQGD